MANVRLGDKVLIQRGSTWFDLYDETKADLIEATQPEREVASEFRRLGNESGFKYYTSKFRYMREFSFYVKGKDETEMMLNTSKTIDIFKQGILKIEGEIFEFPYIIENVNVEFTGVEWYNLIKIKCEILQRLPLQKATNVESVINAGTADSGAKITLKFASEIDVFLGAWGALYDIKAGDTWVLDGLETGSVFRNGKSALMDTWAYVPPFLKPGVNQFVIPADATASVEWYPVFV